MLSSTSGTVGDLTDSPSSIPVQDEHYQLRSGLEKTLVELSGLERLSLFSNPSREKAILVTKGIIECLQQFQSQWTEFLKKLIRIDVRRFGSDAQGSDEFVQMAVRQYVREITDQAGMNPFIVSSPLVAKLICQDGASICDVAKKEISAGIPKMVDQMIVNLDFLLNHGVCGLVTRYPNATCEYFYAYRNLVIDIDRPRFDGFFIEQFRDEAEHATVDRNISGKIKLSICFHHHHVIHAREVRPDRGTGHVPRFHKSVIRAIPDWLRPHVTLVEGTLVSAREYEHDQGEKEMSQSVLVPHYDYDPALIMGQFVLTGWGPKEIEDDLKEL